VSKKTFLVLYDYGTGGVWRVLRASSKEKILRRYPSLLVYDERPTFLSAPSFAIITQVIYDIDEPLDEFFSLFANSSAPGGKTSLAATSIVKFRRYLRHQCHAK
jgi:hypothetical protein